MPQSLSEIAIEQLSIDQRLQLIAVLWDSLPDSPESLPIPKWHKQEIDWRIATADASPELAIPWEQVQARLRRKP